jgi:hypothetical protein
VGRLAGYNWAQYVSSVIGLAIVCVAALGDQRSLLLIRGPVQRSAWVCSLLPATVVVGAAGGVTTEAMQGSSRSHALLFECVVDVRLAGVVGVTAVCLAWRRVLRRATIG